MEDLVELRHALVTVGDGGKTVQCNLVVRAARSIAPMLRVIGGSNNTPGRTPTLTVDVLPVTPAGDIGGN